LGIGNDCPFIGSLASWLGSAPCSMPADRIFSERFILNSSETDLTTWHHECTVVALSTFARAYEAVVAPPEEKSARKTKKKFVSAYWGGCKEVASHSSDIEWGTGN
jgi:hypothetical protein